MLRLRNICKSYKIGKEDKVILDNINIDFKDRELVFILGPSGCGKSTLLNIISGNLRSDSGEILLGDKDICKFSDSELDGYRNSMIGNIFQDYNLIEYMSVIDDVMIASTFKIDKFRINTLLKQIGLQDKKKMIVNKLSGGEKQRVAILRALVNDSKIIIADEPTGALDSENSLKIMEILKKLSKNRLVIVVSHDNELAGKYADRIIKMNDGKVVYLPQISNEEITFRMGKRIRLDSIFKIVFNNLWMKKGRTILTSLAMSFGIIGMLVVLCLSNNFNREIDMLEKDIVGVFPIKVSNGEIYKDNEIVVESNDKIIIKDDEVYKNEIDVSYMKYLEGIKEIKYMTYGYDISMPIISDRYKKIDFLYFEMIPSSGYIIDNYDLLYGDVPRNKGEILLKIDSNNNVDRELMEAFLIDDDIEYKEIVGRKMKVILNDEYYLLDGGRYVESYDYEEMYINGGIEITIVGVIREKDIIMDNSGFLYGSGLIYDVMDKNRDSEIVRKQLDIDVSVLGNGYDKKDMLNYLGYNSIPNSIDIYTSNLDDKREVIRLLDKYNSENKNVIYVDMMADTIMIVKDFVNIISIVMIIFSLVSVLVSSLMIGIFSNMKILERRKEIGILRSIGARKGYIVRLFNIENMIIAIFSVLVSVGLLLVLKKPLNMIIFNMTGLDEMFEINIMLVLIVLIFNIFIVRLAGIIPIRRASRMDITKCIYGR